MSSNSWGSSMFLSDFTDPVQCTKKYCSMMFYDFDLLLVQISTALTKIYVLKKSLWYIASPSEEVSVSAMGSKHFSCSGVKIVVMTFYLKVSALRWFLPWNKPKPAHQTEKDMKHQGQCCGIKAPWHNVDHFKQNKGYSLTTVALTVGKTLWCQSWSVLLVGNNVYLAL